MIRWWVAKPAGAAPESRAAPARASARPTVSGLLRMYSPPAQRGAYNRRAEASRRRASCGGAVFRGRYASAAGFAGRKISVDACRPEGLEPGRKRPTLGRSAREDTRVRHWLYSAVALAMLASPAAGADLARYILPPGNFGGLPTTANSTDQLPLYSGLSPLRDNVTLADIDQLYLPEDFHPIAPTHAEVTGRAGCQVIYDNYGIPHIYGQTQADVAYGAGWATARDRGLLLLIGRGAARVAVADVPNIDAFSLVTSIQIFTPSAAAEALVTAQADLIVKTYKKNVGNQIIADAQAYADGINAYNAAHNVNQPAFTVNDVIAVTAFIGSIFGAGGGAEAANSDLLAKLQQQLGA